MTAYAVGLYNMYQRDWIKTYRAPVTALIARQGGKYLARGSTCRWEMLEGNQPDITGVALIEFPSMDAERAWHRDPEYRPYIGLRRTGSHLDLILFDDPAIG